MANLRFKFKVPTIANFMANLRFKYIKIPRLMLFSAMAPEMLVGISYAQVEDSASVQNTVVALH